MRDRYNLRLERNEHLIRPGNKVRVFVADTAADGAATLTRGNVTTPDITLEELPQVSSRSIASLAANLRNRRRVVAPS